MPAVADSVAELGVGDFDQQVKVIRYANERQTVRWNSGILSGVWLSDPRPAFRMKFDWRTAISGNPTLLYMTGPDGSPGEVGRSGFGWTPQAIHRADAAYEAGLILWEKIDYLFWTWSSPNDMQLHTVYFDLDPDDVMSTLITATAPDHIGTTINADVGIREFNTTGWVESQIPTPAKGILAPHFYMSGDDGAGPSFLEFITSQWRWVGDPTA